MGLAFDGHYMTFVAVTEEGDSNVIDQTGLIHYPHHFQSQFLQTENLSHMLDYCMKELKQQLDFPQKNISVSVSSDFYTLLMVDGENGQSQNLLREKHLWETNVRFGEEYSINHLKIRLPLRNHLMRQQMMLGVYYRREFIESLENASQANHLNLNSITIHALAGFYTIKSVYDINSAEYNLFSIMKISSKYIELFVFRNQLLEGFLLLPQNPIDKVPIYQTGKIGKNCASLIKELDFGRALYKETGPIFVYSTEGLHEEYWQLIEKNDSTGWIDPFANYKSIFKKYEGAEANSPKGRTQNLFTEAAGALYKELKNE